MCFFFYMFNLILVTRARVELQETKYCMPYPTPVFKQHYMLQELGMACNTWFLVVLARAIMSKGNSYPVVYKV